MSSGADPIAANPSGPTWTSAAADAAAMERHRAAVARIARAVRAHYDRGEPFRIHHGSSNSTRPPPAGQRAVDISALRHVLAVDARARTALVEPNVAMDALVEATLPHGLVPPVVMEFPGITAGGGFAGTAGESSSFRHGFFDESVAAVEMVLADGDVVRASPAPADHPDLFAAARGAVGSLGVTTLLELRLVPARRFVRTTYRRTSAVAAAVAAVRDEMARPANDYVDAILFSPVHGAVITGEMADDAPPAGQAPRTFSRPGDEWFYLHVEAATRALPPGGTVVEYVPLAEYLFRYDRGGFWVGRWAFAYFFFVPFTRFFRRLLDDFLHTRMMYRSLHASANSQTFVVQDLALPFRSAHAFVYYAAREFDIWPLWLCPLKRPRGPTFHPTTTTVAEELELARSAARDGASAAAEGPAVASDTVEGSAPAAPPPPGLAPDPLEETHMLNIGLWGPGAEAHARFVAENRALEDQVRFLGGSKWLYAHTYYAEPDFWAQYYRGPGGGRAAYDALRRKYRATSLPSVYDKVKVSERVDGWRDRLKLIWPVGGLWGLWKGIRSRDYLLHRRATWKYKPGKEKEA